MKVLKLKGTEIKIAETIEDVNIKRWVAIKEQVMYKESGADLPTLKTFFTEFADAFDRDSKSSMFIKLYDFINSMDRLEQGKDPDQMIFALITLEKGEDEMSTDTTMLNEKLDRMAKLGITQGMVKENVSAFMNGLLGQ